ncbi:uncharacterized protein LOC128127028 [Lactuca sativa]|uniref:uncharacterized protein LOC128127028 n=1 Tax=Lactuca sativa TaxID=4236 RepID=UPI0022AF4EF3|nr:uncharacterized protein LOC128127028 [Lactuca sativa]
MFDRNRKRRWSIYVVEGGHNDDKAAVVLRLSTATIVMAVVGRVGDGNDSDHGSGGGGRHGSGGGRVGGNGGRGGGGDSVEGSGGGRGGGSGSGLVAAERGCGEFIYEYT